MEDKNTSKAEIIAKSAEKISDSKGLVAIGENYTPNYTPVSESPLLCVKT